MATITVTATWEDVQSAVRNNWHTLSQMNYIANAIQPGDQSSYNFDNLRGIVLELIRDYIRGGLDEEIIFMGLPARNWRELIQGVKTDTVADYELRVYAEMAGLVPRLKEHKELVGQMMTWLNANAPTENLEAEFTGPYDPPRATTRPTREDPTTRSSTWFMSDRPQGKRSKKVRKHRIRTWWRNREEGQLTALGIVSFLLIVAALTISLHMRVTRLENYVYSTPAVTLTVPTTAPPATRPTIAGPTGGCPAFTADGHPVQANGSLCIDTVTKKIIK